MNRTNSNTIAHLLFCLAEEAVEVAKPACKAGRFGENDTSPVTGLPPLVEIIAELNDLVATKELLEEFGCAMPGFMCPEAIATKKYKLLRNMLHGEGSGALRMTADERDRFNELWLKYTLG